MTDERIMLNLKTGTLDSAGLLFERHHKVLYSFFLRRTKDREAAADMTQTVFERIIRYRANFKEERAFKPWMFQIARNVLNHFFNKSAKQKTVDIEDVEVAGQDSVVDKMEDTERNSNLQKAMSHLNDEQRELLILTRFQKMKYKEVAAIYNYSESNVKVKVHRAMKELKDIFMKIDRL